MGNLVDSTTWTEGWIAGLQLAGLAMQSSPDRAEFTRDFLGSHRYIADYLADEVLNRLPDQCCTSSCTQRSWIACAPSYALELLHLMATGLSNQEIADRLIITLGTVKSHANHIFGKLGCRAGEGN